MNDQPPNAADHGDADHREWISHSCAPPPVNYAPELLDQLMRELGERTWNCAFYKVRQFAPELAEEVANEAFQRVCMSILKCRHCQNLPENVTVARCLCLRAQQEAVDLLRSRNALPATIPDANDDMPAAHEVDGIAVWLRDQPYDPDTVSRLQACFGLLDQMEFMVLLLLVVKQQTARAVAEQLEDALKTQEDSEELKAGKINNDELDKRLWQRVYRLRDRALDKIKNCMTQRQDEQP